MVIITSHQRRAIAVEALADEKSVRRAYAGARCKPLTLERIRRAAGRLGYPPPPTADDETTTPRAA